MTAAFHWTESVPRYVLHSRPSWRSGLWRLRSFNLCPNLDRSGKIQSLRHKQEARAFEYHGKRKSFLTLECVRHCYQRAFITKMSSLSVLKSNVVLSSTTKEQNHVIGSHELVHETAIQTLVLASNAEKAGEVDVGNAKMEPVINTPRIEPIVYKRRTRSNTGAKSIITSAESSNYEPIDSEAMARGASLQGQPEEATTKTSHKTGLKRKVADRVSQCIEASEDAELGTNASSYKKKVARKTATDTASGSKRRKVIERASDCTESSMHFKIEENNTESQSLEVAIPKGLEENSTLIEKVDPWLMLVHKKVQPEWIVYNPLTMRCPEFQGNSMKILSWNVNGLRSLLKGKANVVPGTAFLKLAEKEDFDVLCLQETKLQEKDVVTIQEALLPAYENTLWSCSTTKLGYSGTAVISRIKPLSISYGLGIAKHDSEGRVITVEFDNFFLVTCYVPNSGQKLERLAYRTQDWDISLGKFLKDLEKKKPVILTGDLNCAHQEIDIYNPDGNRRSAGFTDEERTSFEKRFLERGFVDTFRKLHPNAVGYTYWGYRTAARPKNHGWRLDYYLASDALLDAVHDSYTLPDVEGSDHCPIGLTLRF